MYFFGGRDERGPNNNLFVLKIGQKPCEWLQPIVAGRPPIPRYGHTMNYYPQKDIVVIFGGRNDEHFASSGDEYLDDVWILSLPKLTWTEWTKEGRGSVPVPRYLHCSAVMGESVVVFGGLSADNYCRADVYALDMEYATSNGGTVAKRSEKRVDAKIALPTVTSLQNKQKIRSVAAGSPSGAEVSPTMSAGGLEKGLADEGQKKEPARRSFFAGKGGIVQKLL